MKRSKFRNIRCELDGYKFDSKKEAERYAKLILAQRAGEIYGLMIHPQWDLSISGKLICRYEGDFKYFTKDGVQVVEDVKSKITITPIYRLKKKLMKAIWGIEIIEVGV